MHLGRFESGNFFCGYPTSLYLNLTNPLFLSGSLLDYRIHHPRIHSPYVNRRTLMHLSPVMLARRRELLCSLVASPDTIAVKSNATAAAGGESEWEVAAPPRSQPTFFLLVLTFEIFLLLSAAGSVVRCLMVLEKVRSFPPRAVHQLPLFNTRHGTTQYA